MGQIMAKFFRRNTIILQRLTFCCGLYLIDIYVYLGDFLKHSSKLLPHNWCLLWIWRIHTYTLTLKGCTSPNKQEQTHQSTQLNPFICSDVQYNGHRWEVSYSNQVFYCQLRRLNMNGNSWWTWRFVFLYISKTDTIISMFLMTGRPGISFRWWYDLYW